MSYLVAKTINATEMLRDFAGEAIESVSGSSPLWTTKTAYQLPTGSPAVALTVSEIGDGSYNLAFVPTTPLSGDDPVYWTYHLVYDDGAGLVREFSPAAPFQVYRSGAAAFDGVSVSVVSPVASTGSVTIYQGDDYRAADSRSLSWSLTGAPSLSGATVTLKLLESDGTVAISKAASSSGTSPQVVAVDLTATETNGLTSNGKEQYTYDLSAVLSNTHVVTLARGKVIVKGDL